jgi:pentatricopeptide repeat protein
MSIVADHAELSAKIAAYAARLPQLVTPEEKRIRKRVLQSIGKLKRKLSEIQNPAQSRLDELTSSPSKRFREGNAVIFSKKGGKAKLRLLNSELADLAKRKLAIAAKKKLSYAIKRGIPVSVHSFSNVINAFVRCEDMENACKIFDKMIQHGIHPNVVTITILLKGYCAINDVNSAAKLLLESNIPSPNIRAINTLLRG